MGPSLVRLYRDGASVTLGPPPWIVAALTGRTPPGNDSAMSSPATALVALFMIVMGLGMAAIWTIDIVRSPEVDRSHGLLRARDRSTGSMLVPHWLAEYATAALLLAGGVWLLLGVAAGSWAWLVAAGLGALAYSALNSLGWVLADRARSAYAVPMVIGFVGAIVSLGLLVAGVVLGVPVV